VTTSSAERSETGEAVADRKASVIRRRFRQICLCLLAAAVTALAAWLGMEMLRAHRQRTAVNAIRGLGGFAQREFEPTGADAVRPRWYQALLGDDFMNPVSIVRLAGTDASDEVLTAVGNLSRVRMLDLRDTRITDNGLQHLRSLRAVEVLVLTGTAVSDRGLEHLAGMRELKVLCLEETKVTDGGLLQLKRFPALGWLNLSSTSITDAGLSHLRECRALEVLIVDPCPVTSEGVKAFQRAAPGTQVYDGSRRRPPFHYFSYKHFR
jgi:hypothetical protein